MDSMFHSDYFGRRGLGSHASSFRMGQDTTPSSTDVAGLSSGIEGFLAQLPPELLGTYNAKYQACQAQVTSGNVIQTVTGAKCLFDLYNELKTLMKNGPPKPATSFLPQDFPYIPVAVGVVGLGVLIWGITKL
jgi:hypothetical protein